MRQCLRNGTLVTGTKWNKWRHPSNGDVLERDFVKTPISVNPGQCRIKAYMKIAEILLHSIGIDHIKRLLLYSREKMFIESNQKPREWQKYSFFLIHHTAVGVFLNKGVVYTYIQRIIFRIKKWDQLVLVSRFFGTVKSSFLKEIQIKIPSK